MKTVKLNNGVDMPVFGLGTYKIKPEDARNGVREAIRNGYRLIDTANAYGNERAVGRGIKESGVKREDIFISTKLWVNEYKNENAIDETLERLGVDYIDLLFIHQPVGDYLAGYKKLEKAYKEGKIRTIGISNFYGKALKKILDNAEIKPQVIQVERHPYYTGKDINDILEENNIQVMAWYPLGHGDKRLIYNSIFKEIGEKYGKTPVQVILRWHIQMGYVVIPGSKNVDHIKENLNIFDFELSKFDMDMISVLDREKKYSEINILAKIFFKLLRPKYEKVALTVVNNQNKKYKFI
ncbi:MAG: aldo/keto reductase [Clostridia bacterium]|nr:aldo/keto reductase [Clostridia bacterium]